MKLSKHHRRSSTSFMNMTPMIDIVFLLIIFYISVFQITRVNDEILKLPQQASVEEKEQTTITINVTQEGEVRIQGRTYTVTEAILFVGDRLAERDNEPGLLTIMLRADKRGTSRTVNELVRQLSQLGITQVRIAVESQA